MLNMHFPVALLITIVAAYSGMTFPGYQDPTAERIPVPSQSQRNAALLIFRDSYKGQLADLSDQGRLTLAAELLEKAETFDQDPVGRYVYLDQSRQLSLEARDLAIALQAILHLERTFEGEEVEGVRLRVDAVKRVAHDAKLDESNAVAERILDLADEFMSSAEPRSAERVLEAGEPLRLKMTEPSLERRWRAAKRHAVERQKADAARKKLQSEAEDSRSLMILGRYLCLVENDFTQGLPLLIRVPLGKTTDKELRRLAESDFAGPTEPEAQLKIGNEWLSFAKALESIERKGAVLRSVYWFEKAQPAFSGTQRGDQVALLIAEARSIELAPVVEVRGKDSRAAEAGLTKPAPTTVITRVSLKLTRKDGESVLAVYYARDAKKEEYEHSRTGFPKPHGTAGPDHADHWREQVRTNLPESCRFDRRVTINVMQPWHPADHSNRKRCSWSCQLEGKGPGDRDKVCTTGET